MANGKMLYSMSDSEKDYDKIGKGVGYAGEKGGHLHL